MQLCSPRLSYIDHLIEHRFTEAVMGKAGTTHFSSCEQQLLVEMKEEVEHVINEYNVIKL